MTVATRRTRYSYTFVPTGKRPDLLAHGIVRRNALQTARIIANRDKMPQDIFRRPEGLREEPWQPYKTAYPNGGIYRYSETDRTVLECVRVLEELQAGHAGTPEGAGVGMAIQKLRSHFKLA